MILLVAIGAWALGVATVLAFVHGAEVARRHAPDIGLLDDGEWELDCCLER